MNKKIAQFGTFEVENYGDLLFPILLEYELSKRLTSLQVELFSPLAKGNVHSIFQEDGTPKTYLADAIVIGGGDIISFSRHISPEYTAKWHHPIGPHAACWAIPSLHKEEKTAILWNAPGVPFPFTQEEAPLVRFLASKASYLSVRDELSKTHLRQAGVEEEISVVPDTALLLPNLWTKKSLEPLSEKLLKPLGIAQPIVFQMHPGLDTTGVSQVLLSLSKKLGKPVLLLPIGYCHEDQSVLLNLYRESKGSFHLIREKLDCKSIAALLAHAGCFIGTSLHGNITAYAYGIPHLIFNGSRLKKLEGFSDLIEEPERLFSTCDQILEKEKLLTKIPSRAVYEKLSAKVNAHFDRMAYRSRSDLVNLDSVRQSKIDSKASDRRGPAPIGQGEEKDRFGEVAASPNSLNLIGSGIAFTPSNNSKTNEWEPYLYLLHAHRALEEKVREYQQCSLLDKFVLCKQFLQRFKRAALSSHSKKLSAIRICKLLLKNGRKIFRECFKHLYLLLEEEKVKILPLKEWRSAIERRSSGRQEDLLFLTKKPLISCLLPIGQMRPQLLRESIDSVLNQSYPYFELCISDQASYTERDSKIGKCQGGAPILSQAQPAPKQLNLKGWAMQAELKSGGCSTNAQGSPKIASIFGERAQAEPIFESRAVYTEIDSRITLGAPKGEYIAIVYPGDILSPDAFYEMVRMIHLHPEADLIYSDEDEIDQRGEFVNPFYKPDWCPDSFLSRNYIQNLSFIRHSLVIQAGGLGTQGYDLLLRVTELTEHIFHIPKILYHRRKPLDSSKCDLQSLQLAMQRKNIDARVELNPYCRGCYTIRYRPKVLSKVSIIIPTKDQTSILKQCIDSIYSKTDYSNFEVIVISNNSRDANLFSLLSEYKKHHGEAFSFYERNIPFNYSKLMNEATSVAKGDYLLFLNNDTEVISGDWITEMVGQAERESIGVVGCKLLYFNNTIQHAGVVLGHKKDLGVHLFAGEKRYASGHFSRLNTINNYSALTAACILCRRSVFSEVCGFDEELEVDCNDLDLCLKIKERGYHNIYLPHVELYHHESLTRSKTNFSKQYLKAENIIRSRWAKYLEHDPCYSGNQR